jgi:osmotically inducible protein OsmC
MDPTGITGVHLAITGVVPGVSPEEFGSIAKGAEENCLISKILKIPVTSEAVLILE